MNPVTRRVHVRVPATSANLGSGFDTVGLALDYHDELTFTLSDDPADTDAHVNIEGEGAQTLPRDETHLVVSTFRRACRTFGLGRFGFTLEAHNRIPQARGMGSSAEAIVAGIAAAAAFAQEGELNRSAIFDLAATIEGHPDNVAPAVFGGLTVSWDFSTAEGVGSVDPRRRTAAWRVPHRQLSGRPGHHRRRVRAGLRTVHRKGASGAAGHAALPGRGLQRLARGPAARGHEPRHAGRGLHFLGRLRRRRGHRPIRRTVRARGHGEHPAVHGYAGQAASAVSRRVDGTFVEPHRTFPLTRLRGRRLRRGSVRAGAALRRRARGHRRHCGRDTRPPATGACCICPSIPPA